MKKISIALLLSAIFVSYPVYSSCPINSTNSCPGILKPQENDIKTNEQNAPNQDSTKINLRKNIKNYNVSCDFGVCSPKPPKR